MRKITITTLLLSQCLLFGCETTTKEVFSNLLNNNESEVETIEEAACLTLVEEPSWFKQGYSFLNSGQKLLRRSVWATTSPSLDEMKTEMKANLVFLPWEMEKEIGEYIVDSKKEKSDIILAKDSSRANRRLYKKAEKVFANVLAKIPEDIAKEYDFRIFVIDNGKGQFNAHAIPGGVILVTNFAVAQSSEDALTLMLSHEVAHVFKRHTVIRFQNTLVDAIETTEEMKELMSTKAKERIFATIDKILDSGQAIIEYPRLNEDEADLCGLSHMYQLDGTNSLKGINEFIAEIEKNTITDEKKPVYPWTLHAHREPDDRKNYMISSREIIANAVKANNESTP